MGARAASARRSRFTRRAAVLALVVALLGLSLAYPLRTYFEQQNEIARLEDEQQAQKNRLAELKRRKELWNDPAYQKAQAREQLQYVEPGEVAYVIIEDPNAAQPEEKKRGQTRNRGPWYDQLWSTAQAADRPKSAR